MEVGETRQPGLGRYLTAVGARLEARPTGALALILAMALALRMVNLQGKNLWYDEAFAVLYAEKDLGSILYGTYALVGGAAADVHPVGYYGFLHFWMALGQAPWVVRLPSVLFGLGAVGLAYVLAKEFFKTPAALAGSAAVAISPFHIWYSQEARMYSLLAMVSLASAYGLVRAIRTGGRGWWGMFILMSAASLYIHNLAIVTVIALQFVGAILAGARHRKQFLMANLALLPFVVPWAVLLWGQISRVGQAYWVGRPGLAELVRTLTTFTFHQPASNVPSPEAWTPWLLFFTFVLLALALRATLPLLRGEDTVQQGALLLVTLAAGPAVLMLLISYLRPIYLERALLTSGVAYAVLVAVAFSYRTGPARSRALPLLATPLVALALSHQYTYDGFPRSPFPQAMAHIRQWADSGDLIVHDNKLSFFPSHYYDREVPQEYLADPPGAGSDTLALPTQEVLGLYGLGAVSEVASTHDRIWFVIFQQAVEEANSRGVPNPHLAWLDTHRVRTGLERFGDLVIYRYDNPTVAG